MLSQLSYDPIRPSVLQPTSLLYNYPLLNVNCFFHFFVFCFIFYHFSLDTIERAVVEKIIWILLLRNLNPNDSFSSDRPHNLYHSTFSHKSEKSPDCSEDLSDYILHRGYVLYNSLSLHCVYNFFKSGNVSTYYIVSFCSITFCCVCCVMADIYHDVLKFCINFFECPAETFAVL